MPFNTELTRALGIRGTFLKPRQPCSHCIQRESPQADTHSPVPVVQGGMQWVGYAELASAVSNAGGLGIVSTHTYSLTVTS